MHCDRRLRTSMCAIIGLVSLFIFHPVSAQEQGPSFRFDPNRTLRFQPDERQKTGMSPDGKMRADVEFKKVRVLSVPDDELIYEFSTPNHAMAPTFSPDQTKLLYADCTGNLACKSILYVRDLKSGKQVTLGSCFGATMKAAFSGDGERVAVVTVYGPILSLIPQQRFNKLIGGEIAVFDLESTNELMHTSYELQKKIELKGDPPAELPTQIALDHDGKTLLVAAASGVVKVIDVRTHTEKFSVTVPEVSAK